MTSFPEQVLRYWEGALGGQEITPPGAAFSLSICPELDAQRQIMLLEEPAGRVRAALTPEWAARLGVASPSHPPLSLPEFRRRLAEAGAALHGADHLFYLPGSPEQGGAVLPADVRQLTEHDREVFAQFQVGASPQDLDDAWVELDHWAVFGAFDSRRLVCAASMYPWHRAPIADLGILTLPEYRGRGYGQAVVRAACHFAQARDHAPQYRCQLGNAASVRLAQAAGFRPFGVWEVLDADASAAPA